MAAKVFITGAGIISSIGLDYKEVLSSLKASRSGIGKMTLIDSVHKEEIPVAEIKKTNAELKELANVPGKAIFSRTSLLGIIAAREALSQAEIENTSEYRTGLISASTVGGMDRTEKFLKKYLKDKNHGRLRDIITHDMGDSTEKIAEYCRISDYVTTISTACSSSANAIMVGSRLIENGILDRALVGGVDCLTLFTINGFNSLMILDKNGCRPFDENRNGLTLGEGAAFLVLESERIVEKTGKKIFGAVSGYGNACDAFHQTASSPGGDGAFLSMQKALLKAGITPDKIDYINAHGTGTKNNDLSEGNAIERLFGNSVPPCSSTKSFTGHTLGAAGGIEAVFSVMAIEHQCIWPNLNFANKMNELGFLPVTELRKDAAVRNVLSNSFGFGGNNTSLIFSKC
ncbi:MAG: beta-ketoacyl-[acyl-carrier-protein] synthase family protein [Bacteroidia bacterium]|nr:beta-ketoacyl-[acyl-carrier-protein] synthase family protein [Bacteroidia bacterium]